MKRRTRRGGLEVWLYLHYDEPNETIGAAGIARLDKRCCMATITVEITDDEWAELKKVLRDAAARPGEEWEGDNSDIANVAAKIEAAFHIARNREIH